MAKYSSWLGIEVLVRASTGTYHGVVDQLWEEQVILKRAWMLHREAWAKGTWRRVRGKVTLLESEIKQVSRWEGEIQDILPDTPKATSPEVSETPDPTEFPSLGQMVRVEGDGVSYTGKVLNYQPASSFILLGEVKISRGRLVSLYSWPSFSADEKTDKVWVNLSRVFDISPFQEEPQQQAPSPEAPAQSETPAMEVPSGDLTTREEPNDPMPCVALELPRT